MRTKSIIVSAVLIHLFLFCSCGKNIPKHEQDANKNWKILLDNLEYPEAPFWSSLDSRLYFVEWAGNRINYYEDGRPGVFIENEEGDGPSGIIQDGKGNWWVCLYSSRKVVKLSPTGGVLKEIDNYRGEGFKGPNDLVMDSKGGIYFTDSGDFEDDWKTGWPAGSIYYISLGGGLVKADSDLCYPNGLAVSPRGKTLYVGEHRKNRIVEYYIEQNGALSEREIFFKLDDKCVSEKESCFELGPDGMWRDSTGNLWVAHYRGGKIIQISPEGRSIRKIKLPAGSCPTNIFLGPDEKTAYVTEAELGLLYELRIGEE